MRRYDRFPSASKPKSAAGFYIGRVSRLTEFVELFAQYCDGDPFSRLGVRDQHQWLPPPTPIFRKQRKADFFSSSNCLLAKVRSQSKSATMRKSGGRFLSPKSGRFLLHSSG